jgi:hypothetical protein
MYIYIGSMDDFHVDEPTTQPESLLLPVDDTGGLFNMDLTPPSTSDMPTFRVRLLHKCFELLCSLHIPFGWVYVFYVGRIDKIMKPFSML